MNVVAIARKEFRDVRRSNALWALTAVVTVLLVVPVLTRSGSAPGTDLTPVETAVSSQLTLGTFLLPLALLVPSYDAITGELESGSVTYLLGLPNTRLEAVAGKLAGRTAAATLGVLVAFGIGGALVVVEFGSLPVGTYLAVVSLTAYFTAVWTSVGVGISALAGSRGRALAGALGTYFVFVFAWLVVPSVSPRRLAAYAVESVLGLAGMPALYDFVFRLSPATAYAFAGNGVITGGEDSGAFFLQDWFMLVILFGWLVGPLVAGYLRFRNAELTA